MAALGSRMDPAWLSDYRFNRLGDPEKLALVLMWMLAGQLSNRIPADPEWLQWRLAISSPVDLRALYDAGFIELHGLAPDDLPGVKVAPPARARGAYRPTPADLEVLGVSYRSPVAPPGASYPASIEEEPEEPGTEGLVWPPAAEEAGADPTAAADLFATWSKRQPV